MIVLCEQFWLNKVVCINGQVVWTAVNKYMISKRLWCFSKTLWENPGCNTWCFSKTIWWTCMAWCDDFPLCTLMDTWHWCLMMHVLWFSQSREELLIVYGEVYKVVHEQVMAVKRLVGIQGWFGSEQCAQADSEIGTWQIYRLCSVVQSVSVIRLTWQ